MIYSIILYYNFYVLVPLEHEFTHKDEYKCIENYSSSISLLEFSIICYLISAHNIIKINKAILMSPIDLYYNHCVLEPLQHE
jgi:hypothetical protein